jgi:hypothetical protein
MIAVLIEPLIPLRMGRSRDVWFRGNASRNAANTTNHPLNPSYKLTALFDRRY